MARGNSGIFGHGSQPCREGILAVFTGSECEVVRVFFNFPNGEKSIVEIEKQFARDGCCAFLPIEKRVIFSESKRVCCRELAKIYLVPAILKNLAWTVKS